MIQIILFMLTLFVIFTSEEIIEQLAQSESYYRYKTLLKTASGSLIIAMTAIVLNGYFELTCELTFAHILIYLLVGFGIALMYYAMLNLKAARWATIFVCSVCGIIVYAIMHGVDPLFLLMFILFIPLIYWRRSDFKNVKLVLGISAAVIAGALFALSDGLLYIIGDASTYITRFLIQQTSLMIILSTKNAYNKKRNGNCKERTFLSTKSILICAFVVCILSGFTASLRVFFGIDPMYYPWFRFIETFAAILCVWPKNEIRDRIKTRRNGCQ